MASKTLNRPNNWLKQVNPNTKRMRQLMRDVRANVERRTRNSQDLDAWMENLSEYVGNNCFSTGIHATDALDIVNQIAGVVDQTSLPAGSNAEILKGTMAEKCYTMVTNVGEDIKNELRQIAVNGYNDRLTPQQLAKEMGNKIESLDKARCQAIARTETCRAANIGNYINAREMGAKSYSVICNDGCCEYCQEVYGTDDGGGVGEEIFDIEDTDSLPPFHPNCRCTPVWSMDPPPGTEDETSETNEELENETNEPTEYSLNNRENSFSDVKIIEEQFQNVIAHQSKRENAKLEFGNAIDNETGKLIHNKDIRGKKNRVNVPTHYKPYSVIHNHTNDGGFSGGDAYSHLLGSKQQVCYATTPKGIWIMRDTSQGAFIKKDGFISENTATEIKYQMEGKYREFAKEGKAKYQEAYDNAKNPQEKEKIKQKLNNEVFTNYNNWLLDEFAVGKRRDWLIEIEFIPKERLKDVKF